MLKKRTFLCETDDYKIYIDPDIHPYVGVDCSILEICNKREEVEAFYAIPFWDPSSLLEEIAADPAWFAKMLKRDCTRRYAANPNDDKEKGRIYHVDARIFSPTKTAY